jgi:hypothetical protein
MSQKGNAASPAMNKQQHEGFLTRLFVVSDQSIGEHMAVKPAVPRFRRDLIGAQITGK